METTSTPRILRLPEVKATTGLSRSTIYDWVARGLFPAPIRLGPQMIGWVGAEIEEWVRARIVESRSSGKQPVARPNSGAPVEGV